MKTQCLQGVPPEPAQKIDFFEGNVSLSSKEILVDIVDMLKIGIDRAVEKDEDTDWDRDRVSDCD